MKTGRAGLTLCSVLFLATATGRADARSLIVHRSEIPEPIVLAPPADAQNDNRPTVMFVEFRQPAKFVGFPKICPGSPPDANPEEEICLAELYQGPASRLRHLSGPRTSRSMRLRTTAHSAHVFLRPDNLLLVAARPFDDEGTKGIFAHWWIMADEKGRFCLRESQIAELGLAKYWGRAKLWVEDGPYVKDPIRRRCLTP